MTTRAFWRRALLLPVVIPLGALPFAFNAAGNPVLQVAALVLVGSLVWGGLPYACFVIVLLRGMSRTEAGDLVGLAWRSPPRFAWMQGGFVALYQTSQHLIGPCNACTPWWDVGVWTVVFSVLGAAFGYAYVALAVGLHAVLRRLDVVRD